MVLKLAGKLNNKDFPDMRGEKKKTRWFLKRAVIKRPASVTFAFMNPGESARQERELYVFLEGD